MKASVYKYHTKTQVEELRNLMLNNKYEAVSIINEIKENEDSDIFIKWLFYIGDIKNGLGERDLFRLGLFTLTDNPSLFGKLLPLIPQYTRWDVLINLAYDISCKEKQDDKQEDSNLHKCSNMIFEFIAGQLQKDIKNKDNKDSSISLLAKWLPSINTSSKATREMASVFCNYFGMTAKEYRHTLRDLRNKLDIIETKMSSNKWEDINIDNISTSSLKVYKESLLRHSVLNEEDISDIMRNKKELYQEEQIQPISLQVSNSISIGKSGIYDSPHDQAKLLYDNLCENNRIENQAKGKSNIELLPILDCSSDMNVTKTDVKGLSMTAKVIGSAVSVYIAEQMNQGSSIYIDKLMILGRSSLFNIVAQNRQTSYQMSTDNKLEKVIKLSNNSNMDYKNSLSYLYKDILQYAISNNLSSSDLPNNILIMTDKGNRDADKDIIMNSVKRCSSAYFRNNIKIPNIIIWNIHETEIVKANRYKDIVSLTYIDGFSLDVMNTIVHKNHNPFRVFMQQLDSKRYKKLDDILNKEAANAK